MSAAERNYPIHDKEILAIVRALGKWRAGLEGLQSDERFSIYTDHHALQYFMTKKQLNARQARWAEFLSRFHFVSKYQPGKDNIPADILTRREGSSNVNRESLILPADTLDPRIYQSLNINSINSDIPLIHEIVHANQTSPSLETYRNKANTDDPKWQFKNNLLTFENRLEVAQDDETLKTRFIHDIHDQKSTAHPGQRKMLKHVHDWYHWSGWRSDVIRYVKDCTACQRAKNPRDKIPGLL